MRISAAQIRAARGLLDWSREELAQMSGLSYNTIRNLEAGNLSPRENTAARLCRAFAGAGISFIEDDGLRRERADVKILKGPESTESFFENLFHTIKRKGGDVVGLFWSQEQLTKSLGVCWNEGSERLSDLGLFASSTRFIFSDPVIEASLFLLSTAKTAPRYCLGPVCYLVYGQRVALIQSEGRDQFRYIIFNDVDMSVAYREHFETLWTLATPVLPALEKDRTGKHTARTS